MKHLKKSVFEREEISSTSIGDLTAIPHPIATDTKKSFISILVLNKPIMWGDFFSTGCISIKYRKIKS